MPDLKETPTWFCSELIKMDTSNPPGGEKRAAEFCHQLLESWGYETQLIDHGEDRASLVAVMEGLRGADVILIVGHLDTVPAGDLTAWKTDPFSGKIDQKYIYGRGASDMKGGLSVMLHTARLLRGKKIKNTIIFAFTADEEGGCRGANALLDLDLIQNAKLILIPEPTSNQIGIAEKGALWLRLVSYGKSAHGSMPELGINAIEKMIKMINNLEISSFREEHHPYLGSFTHSLNTIKGGIKTNVVPDCCDATLDIRTLPSQDHFQIMAAYSNSLNCMADKDPHIAYKLETIINKPGIEIDPTNPLVAQVLDLIQCKDRESRLIGLNYFTDGAVLVPRLKIPFLIYGPGDANQAHKNNERILISKLLHSCEIYEHLIRALVIE